MGEQRQKHTAMGPTQYKRKTTASKSTQYKRNIMIRDNGHPSKIRTFLVEFFRPRYSAKEITQLLVTLFVVQMIGRELLRFNISPDSESIEFLGGSLTVQSYRWQL